MRVRGRFVAAGKYSDGGRFSRTLRPVYPSSIRVASVRPVSLRGGCKVLK